MYHGGTEARSGRLGVRSRAPQPPDRSNASRAAIPKPRSVSSLRVLRDSVVKRKSPRCGGGNRTGGEGREETRTLVGHPHRGDDEGCRASSRAEVIHNLRLEGDEERLQVGRHDGRPVATVGRFIGAPSFCPIGDPGSIHAPTDRNLRCSSSRCDAGRRSELNTGPALDQGMRQLHPIELPQFMHL